MPQLGFLGDLRGWEYLHRYSLPLVEAVKAEMLSCQHPGSAVQSSLPVRIQMIMPLSDALTACHAQGMLKTACQWISLGCSHPTRRLAPLRHVQFCCQSDVAVM